MQHSASAAPHLGSIISGTRNSSSRSESPRTRRALTRVIPAFDGAQKVELKCSHIQHTARFLVAIFLYALLCTSSPPTVCCTSGMHTLDTAPPRTILACVYDMRVCACVREQQWHAARLSRTERVRLRNMFCIGKMRLASVGWRRVAAHARTPTRPSSAARTDWGSRVCAQLKRHLDGGGIR